MPTNVQIQPTDKVVYPELSYKLVGIFFDIHNNLGGGLKESVYEKAICEDLKTEGINFRRQLSFPIVYKDNKVGQRYIDLLVEEKIIVELKVGDRFKKTNIDQIFEYLKANNLKLGILVNFGSKEVKYRRILNII